MSNDLPFVEAVTRSLRSRGVEVWLAGGWAEELHGMVDPRPHHDVDLLVRANSFNAVDDFLSQDGIAEIAEKRFAHKRAFEADATMVEMILVRPDLTSLFWGEHQYRWPVDTFEDETGMPRLVSPTALRHYRSHRPPALAATEVAP